MQRPLGHSTALRTVGQIFDAEAAHQVLIEERTDSVWLSWDGRQGAGRSARYRWGELDQLQHTEHTDRTDSPMARLRQQWQDTRVWSDLLRTLGQDLDEDDADTSTITGDLNWITASWISGGRYVTRQYTAAELREASRLRATLRRPF